MAAMHRRNQRRNAFCMGIVCLWRNCLHGIWRPGVNPQYLQRNPAPGGGWSIASHGRLMIYRYTCTACGLVVRVDHEADAIERKACACEAELLEELEP